MIQIEHIVRILLKKNPGTVPCIRPIPISDEHYDILFSVHIIIPERHCAHFHKPIAIPIRSHRKTVYDLSALYQRELRLTYIVCRSNGGKHHFSPTVQYRYKTLFFYETLNLYAKSSCLFVIGCYAAVS